jgi:hypothetical protein
VGYSTLLGFVFHGNKWCISYTTVAFTTGEVYSTTVRKNEQALNVVKKPELKTDEMKK